MATTNSSEVDEYDHRSDAYTLSADVSESESAITLSDSLTNSPPRFRSIPDITLPLECHANVVEIRDATDPSGMFCIILQFLLTFVLGGF